MTSLPNIAVVGATGAVGREIISVLQQREFPARAIPVASPRSQGKIISANGQPTPVQNLAEFNFAQCRLALFSPGKKVSAEHAPRAAKHCTVIDNTSHFRMDPDTPLVVPEVNGHDISAPKNIIANPNCSTIQLVMTLKPLLQLAPLVRVVADTYQAASGAGNAGLQELNQQQHDLQNERPAKHSKFTRRLAANVIPQIDTFLDSGDTREEWKMQVETRKILGLPELRVQVTCVRVPVAVAHSVAAHVEFEKPVQVGDAVSALRDFPGVKVAGENEDFTTPADAAGRDHVFVSRLRQDNSVKHGLSMWIVADNLRKGAALNAVQIAETLLKRDNGRLSPN
ncbi:MAG: aspartate-semialdehyde dehydrogenase [Alphaproteobacteria bacterium]|nr:aspartate-semialdehyde dehydrogenase [Alphaproteobacteria bacterium]